ncbi:LuxR C-terminal-related transcriptional regulator, partial [Streptomyces neyagawaensis]|uniref:LuxR C-terminal-related transcriptional regulator n=1 Tax=Streptomyces neyagawaensis TaxID=42238 RepID=UPI00201CFB3C
LRIAVAEGHVEDAALGAAALRDYGLEKLNDLGETVATRRRHRDHFARLGAAYERAWFGPDQVGITERLRIDQDDFRAALDFCLTTPGEAQHGLRLASTLWFYWVAYGIWGEGRHWMDGALLVGARPDGSLTRALWAGALTSLVHSRSAAVLAGLDPARPAPADDSELPVPAPPPVTLGPGGLARTSHASFVVLTRIELACTLVSRGRAAEAIPLCAEAVALCEAHGEQWARSWALRTLALAHWSAGEYARAAGHARACLRLPYTEGQHQSLARTLDLLAAAEALAGRAERAAVLHGAVDRIWHAIGGDPTAAHRAGRPGVAERRARQVLGDPAYERARLRGAGLSPEESVAYALAEGGERAGTATLREDPAVVRRGPAPSAPRGLAPAAHGGPAPVGRTGPAPAVPKEPAPDLREGRSPAGNPAPGSAATAGPPADPVPLTRRELQVAALVAQGRTNKQIADHLVIARRTAEGHVERILAKLGFRNRSQVAAWFSARSWS